MADNIRMIGRGIYKAPEPKTYNPGRGSQRQRLAGGPGSQSLQTPGTIAPITNGETNKFAGDTSTADSILEAGKPRLSNPAPYIQKEDLVSQALGAPNVEAAGSGLQTVENNKAYTKLGDNLESGQGTINDSSGNRLYDIEGDKVTAFDAQGNPRALKGTVSVLQDRDQYGNSTAAGFKTEADAAEHAKNMAYAKAGYAYDPAERAAQMQARGPRLAEGPSDYEMRLAAKNAAVGGSDNRAKMYYAQLLKEKQSVDEQNKNILGASTAIQSKQIEAGAHKYGADQARLGQESANKATLQAQSAKAKYDAYKDAQELGIKKQELAQKEAGRLGTQALDLGKLNEMYDAKIAEQATQGTPESAAGLQQGRAAALITATGDVEKALKSDPTAMAIISSNEAPEAKVEKLKRLHPQYANYFLSQK